MKQEKIKEIKKALEQNDDNGIMYEVNDEKRTCKFIHHKDILTLINELESENERLQEYIKGNEQDAKAFVNRWHKDLKKELELFTEKLKESAGQNYVSQNGVRISDITYSISGDTISKILKDFINKNI